MLGFLVSRTTVSRKISLLKSWSVWLRYSKAAEVLTIKGELSRVAMALQDIKFQENLFRTNMIMQRNELESKMRELVVA